MHRKSSRLLKSIVILSIENPQSHTDNARKYGVQKIADTLRTRMLGKSPVCQNSGVGKKGEMLESCQHHQQRGKKQISNRRQKNPFQLMSFVRLPTRTREHQPERIACLGIESSGSRTHDLLLRRRKQGFPPTPLRCPQTLAITTFLTNSIVPDSSKKHLFYPSAISRKLAELILAVGHFPTAFAKISQMTDITFLKMPSNRRKIFSIIKPCTLL